MPINLVAIGDSLTQGFQSGCIHNTENSYPALIARALGYKDFNYPLFPSDLALPINLEYLARDIGKEFHPWEFWDLAKAVTLMDRVEDYWERGPGSRNTMESGVTHTNLAVWGFDVIDSVSLSEGLCERQITKTKRRDDAAALPDFPMYRTARRTLNPQQTSMNKDLTQIDLAEKLALENGGIKTIIFWLGANNALGTVLQLHRNPVWSSDQDLYAPAHERVSTLWTPAHFKKAYSAALEKLAKVNADCIVFGNVPHLSIPPISRGVSLCKPEQDAEGYFEYYIPCWVKDDSFRKSPKSFPSFARDRMRMINNVVDDYNQIIADLIAQYVAKGKDWKLVDLCSVLDSLAYRKTQGQPTYVFPNELENAAKSHAKVKDRFDSSGRLIMDTRFLCYRPRMSKPEEKYEGGFFSLDGVHPTTIGYGLIAYEYLKAMGQQAKANQAWWEYVVSSDSLVTETPEVLEDVLNFLEMIGRDGFLRKVQQAMAGIFD